MAKIDHARLASVCVMLAAAIGALACPLATQARESGLASDYLLIQRWLFEADTMANEGVTHEICGWGSIDMRTPFMMDVVKHIDDPSVWDDLAKRFDHATRERRK